VKNDLEEAQGGGFQGKVVGFRVEARVFQPEGLQLQLEKGGFRVEGLCFRVEEGSFRVGEGGFQREGPGLRVEGSGFLVEGREFRVEEGGFRVEGAAFRVENIVFQTGQERIPIVKTAGHYHLLALHGFGCWRACQGSGVHSLPPWPASLQKTNKMPVPASLPAAPPAVAPGILPRLRALVGEVKGKAAYTPSIGADLNVVVIPPTADSSPPTLAIVSPQAGNVTLKWSKQGWDGVKVQGRVPGSMAWTDLGTDAFSPFVDTRPLAAAHTPEVREYRMCHLDGDDPLNNWSDVLVVNVNV